MSLAMWSERNRKRRELLTSYFFDLSKLMCGGVVGGGLSPLFTGGEMGLYNIFVYCLVEWRQLYLLILPMRYLKLNLENNKAYGNVDDNICLGKSCWGNFSYLV